VQLTQEQQAILSTDPVVGKPIKVTAFAGTGKTFTLTEYAKSRPRFPMTYIAYNKSIQLHAEKVMPRNVTSRTIHSLAFAKFGRRYKDKLGNLKIGSVMRYLGIREYKFAMFITRTLEAYLASSYDEIDENCVPRGAEKLFGPNAPDILVSMAKKAWNVCQDEDDTDLVMPHDGYLKLYQLSRPQINTDVVLMDEAQDTTPCVWHIIMNQRAPKIVVGDPHQAIYCQPLGTMVDVPERDSYHTVGCKKVPIEDLRVGDFVATYHNSHVYKKGRPLTGVSRVHYDGDLVRATLESGESSAYTLKHHCIVRVGGNLRGKHVVYLMKKGGNFRVGRVPFFYDSQGRAFGLGVRSSSEGAEASWILSVHDTAAEAITSENLVQALFGIPGVRFKTTSKKDVMDVTKFWSLYSRAVSDQTERALKCLKAYGRLIEHPLWTSGMGRLVGTQRPFITAAANLLDGFLALPSGSWIKYKNKRDHAAPRSLWKPIKISHEHYEGDIVSLEVGDHHTYYGDGILTHNSFRGAVNAMDQVVPEPDRDLPLTHSFRFGPVLAQEASLLLKTLKQEPRTLHGNELLKTQLHVCEETVTRPGSLLLCRGNSMIFEEAYEATKKGSVGFIGGSQGYRLDMYLDGMELSHDNKGAIVNPLFKAFSNFSEFAEFAEVTEDVELGAVVNAVMKHGSDIRIRVETIRGAETDPARAAFVFSTIHKAKGLEWPTVVLGQDISRVIQAHLDNPEDYPYGDDEANLLYVSLTRGINEVFIPTTVYNFIRTGRKPPKLKDPTARIRSLKKLNELEEKALRDLGALESEYDMADYD
jgi:F-box protein 18 (helicase)